jgi:EmrB/QacA subfamily drug resistance transporter
MDASTPPKPPQPLTHAETRRIIMGMMMPVFMSSLDQTILASALPAIGREFGDLQALPWLIIAYLIAMTAATPLYGKFSDIHGRRATVRIAVLVYMAGSLVCALAPSMPVLILGRVLHGLGGAGLASMGMVVLGDVAAPKERAKYYGYLSITYTTAGAVGPALGGFLSDVLHWSAIFWINLPLGLATVFVTVRLLRKLPRHDRPHRLDLAGAGLIVLSSVAFMLALNMGGVRYPWTSPPVLALLAVALVMGALFVARLLTAPEPLIPIAILKDPVVRCVIVANASGWGPIVGLNIFLPMYLQSVLGLSATAAGLSLMVMMVALNTAAGMSSPLLGRATHYKRLPTLGLLIAIGAVLTLAWQADRMNLWLFELLIVLIGIGFGSVPPLTSVALQNAVSVHQFGTAVGTMNFNRHLYGTFLVALFGTIVLAGIPSLDPAHLTPAAAAAAADNAAAFSRVFFAAAASHCVTLIALVLLPEKPLLATR